MTEKTEIGNGTTTLVLTEAEVEVLLLAWGLVTSFLIDDGSEEGDSIYGKISESIMQKLDNEKSYPALESLTKKLLLLQDVKTLKMIQKLRKLFDGTGPVANV